MEFKILEDKEEWLDKPFCTVTLSRREVRFIKYRLGLASIYARNEDENKQTHKLYAKFGELELATE